MRKIDAIVIHCAATPNGQPYTVEQIRRDHLARGFDGVGYHYVITIDGTIHSTRPEERLGAHVKDHNKETIGVCMVGGVGGTDKHNPGRYTPKQWDALQTLIASLRAKHKAKVCGHRDYSPDLDGDGVIEPHEWIKLCPSFDVAAWLANGMRPLPAHIYEAG